MKAIFLNCLLIVSTTTTFAKEALQVEVIRFLESDNYSLHINNPSLSNVKVALSNEKGEMIFTEQIPSIERFRKVYNLSSLPQGTYKIIVSNRSETVSNTLNLNQAKGSHPDLGKTLVAAFSKVQDKKVTVVAQNKSGKNIKVTLYDRSDKKITDILSSKQSLIKQKVDLGTLVAGNYKLRISDGNSVYASNIVLD